MRIPISKLSQIFDGNIPAEALELIEQADETITNAVLLEALVLMREARTDPRIARGLAIAKQVYSKPGETFETTYSKEDGDRILVVMVKLLVEIFKDLDNKKPTDV